MISLKRKMNQISVKAKLWEGDKKDRGKFLYRRRFSRGHIRKGLEWRGTEILI